MLLTQEMLDSPGALIAALHPVVSATPRAYRDMVAPDELAAALAGGDTLDPATRLRVGEALVTGVGAPRAVDDRPRPARAAGDEWNGPAALLVGPGGAIFGRPADGLCHGAARDGGRRGGRHRAGRRARAGAAARHRPWRPVRCGGQWPGAADAQATADELIAAGDVAGMRRRAFAAAAGRNRPRDYADAYYWASLAAAAGDRGAAGLRRRLDNASPASRAGTT